ncbi:MAG: polysaccharide deacetylase family protein [Sphingobacteriales bacterium]|nr:polysaccharide deacetylase family protein [Sphingobacteriales bacterium]
MILIYTGKTTNRLRYIFEHILKYVLGLKVKFTTNIEEFNQHTGAKINYSSRAFNPNELFFYASPLLFERRIKPQQLKIENFEDTKIFFISKNNSDLPFDIFAASFYLISRYEEYLPDAQFDQHQRYLPENSLAYHHNFLQQPIVDVWIKKLEKILKNRFPDLAIKRRPYHFTPTYDIDIAYAFSHKGFLRTTAGWLHTLYKRDFDELNTRMAILKREQTDPYDTYEWQYELQKKYDLKSIYFFLLGNYGQYDKNLPADNLALHELICYLSDVCPIGIHPSYESNKDIQIVANEIAKLAQIVKKEIRRSRQHYLRLNIPDTYQKLLELDVEKDYTMGYASQVGFRAGTASSFYFYDLNLEIKTTLRVYPFAVMDVTLHDYLKLTPQQALQLIEQLINATKAVDGLFCTVWHNNTLSNYKDWEGWRMVYEETVKMALK